MAFQDAQLHTTGKGDLFERLVQLFLLTAPQYKSKLSNVWWPKFEKLPKGVAEHLNLTFSDEGIDLIAKTNDGEYWPIQAKYESNTAGAKQKSNLTTFSNAAFNNGENMHLGLVAHTKAKPIRKRKLLESEKKGNKIIELGLSYWLELDEQDWSAIKQQASGETYRPDPRTPRDHQNLAIKKAKKHFIASKADRGRLIMPCASGKSLTAYWVAKTLNAKSIIVAVPSLSLVKQTVKDWTREYIADKSEPDWMCICSDKATGKLDDENDDFVKDIYDLGLPVTTDRDTISAFLQKESKSPKIIFTTYMSSPILAEAAKNADVTIDFCIFDEAHKTAGRKDKRSTALLNQENINIKKRLFMTATERFLSGSGNNEKAFSMNDKSVYGERFHALTFKEAIDQKIICDYKIITMAVSKPEIDELIDEHKYVINEDGGKELLDAASLAAGIALDKTIKIYGAKHAISFHRSIDSAKHFNNQQALLSGLGVVGSDVEYNHISSKLSTGERSQVMSDFVAADKSVMTNAKCLTEGVDIPAIDCVLFASPKQSVVDIVQAAGRAMRPDRDNGKEFGYILLPIVVPDGIEFEDFASTTEFKVVAKQLSALSSQDERIAEYFRLIDKGDKPSGNPLEIVGDIPVGMNINFNDFASAVQTKLWDKIGKLNWRSFEEARKYVHTLKLKGQSGWFNFAGTKHKPADIPHSPAQFYPEWTNWGDWLGTGTIATRLREYRSFDEAKKFVHTLKLTTFNPDWIAYCQGRKKHLPLLPDDIPFNADKTYANEWLGWGDWLGTGRVATHLRHYRSYEAAKAFVMPLGLRSEKGGRKQDDLELTWRNFATGKLARLLGELPDDIPASPTKVYDEFTSWPDFLGNGGKSRDIEYWSYAEARQWVIKLELYKRRIVRTDGKRKNDARNKWNDFCAGLYPDLPTKPLEIPVSIHYKYKDNGYIGYKHFITPQGE